MPDIRIDPSGVGVAILPDDRVFFDSAKRRLRRRDHPQPAHGPVILYIGIVLSRPEELAKAARRREGLELHLPKPEPGMQIALNIAGVGLAGCKNMRDQT